MPPNVGNLRRLEKREFWRRPEELKGDGSSSWDVGMVRGSTGADAQTVRRMLKSRIFLLRVLMSTSSTRAAWALFHPVDCSTRSTYCRSISWRETSGV